MSDSAIRLSLEPIFYASDAKALTTF
ncbi:hypothetical protein TNCV_4438021 [Trichonephila clavipes]|nr:hypothetical protein TNCV_4438021 [Trichonephila clavipes]